MRRAGSSLRKAELLPSVLAALALARTTLRWSYVFAFYMNEMAPEVNRPLFEDRQHELEAALRRLTSLVEKETPERGVTWASKEDLMARMDEIGNVSAAVLKWVKNLKDCPHEFRFG